MLVEHPPISGSLMFFSIRANPRYPWAEKLKGENWKLKICVICAICVLKKIRVNPSNPCSLILVIIAVKTCMSFLWKFSFFVYRKPHSCQFNPPILLFTKQKSSNNEVKSTKSRRHLVYNKFPFATNYVTISSLLPR